MPPRPLPPDAIRAALVASLPGVTMKEACERYGVTRAAITRARRERPDETRLSSEDLLLAALTQEGRRQAGELPDLEMIARWIDHVNHDGSDARDVRARLAQLKSRGRLALDGDKWRLLRAWP